MAPRREEVSARPDYVLMGTVLGVCLFGLLMLYDASVVAAERDFGNPYHYVSRQAIWFVFGLVALLVTSKIDYHFWQKIALPMVVGGILLLLAVFIPGLGVEAYGAQRWINLGFTTLQPAYPLAFALIVYFASWLSRQQSDWSWKETFLPLAALLSFILGVVVILQRDLGTSLVLATTSLGMYFLAGGPILHIVTFVMSGILGGVMVILLEPYRRDRVLSFLDPSHATQEASYHINQVLIALGTGGLLGVGIGQSRQKYSYIPEVQNDSIFAVIAEELGYVGALFLLAVFLFILWRGFAVARTAPDAFGRLLVSGIMLLISVQVFVNLFAMTGLVPLTGIPLPFISNGGTSLIILLAAMGIVLNVSKQTTTK